jgi:TolA-binding protein
MLTKQNEMISTQNEQIRAYERRIAELQHINQNLQKLFIEKSNANKNSKSPIFTQGPTGEINPFQQLNGFNLNDTTSKSEPLFKLDASMI